MHFSSLFSMRDPISISDIIAFSDRAATATTGIRPSFQTRADFRDWSDAQSDRQSFIRRVVIENEASCQTTVPSNVGWKIFG